MFQREQFFHFGVCMPCRFQVGHNELHNLRLQHQFLLRLHLLQLEPLFLRAGIFPLLYPCFVDLIHHVMFQLIHRHIPIHHRLYQRLLWYGKTQSLDLFF